MMKQMVVTYDTEVLHTIKTFSNANNHELFSCAPPPLVKSWIRQCHVENTGCRRPLPWGSGRGQPDDVKG